MAKRLHLEYYGFPPARDKFSLPPWLDVYLVLEDDGTEVDEEEYFQVQTLSGIDPFRNKHFQVKDTFRNKHLEVQTLLCKKVIAASNTFRYKHFMVKTLSGTNLD